MLVIKLIFENTSNFFELVAFLLFTYDVNYFLPNLTIIELKSLTQTVYSLTPDQLDVDPHHNNFAKLCHVVLIDSGGFYLIVIVLHHGYRRIDTFVRNNLVPFILTVTVCQHVYYVKPRIAA
jgi:hypothetical protein